MSNELVNANHYKSELDYARDVGKLIVGSGKWSKDWNQDTVAVLVLYAKDLGIHPVKALMNGFDIIQGKISMKPILMSEMIRRAGHSIKILKNSSEICVLKGVRKDNGDTCEVSFSLEDAKRAKLGNKDNYVSWGADMLYNRALGRLARMLFSDVIGGAYTTDEGEDIKKHSKLELQEVTNELEAEVQALEQPQHIEQLRTVTDLQLALMQIGVSVEPQSLFECVAAKAKEHDTSEFAIIRSALSSEKQLKAFSSHVIAYDEVRSQAIKDATSA